MFYLFNYMRLSLLGNFWVLKRVEIWVAKISKRFVNSINIIIFLIILLFY